MKNKRNCAAKHRREMRRAHKVKVDVIPSEIYKQLPGWFLEEREARILAHRDRVARDLAEGRR